MPSLGKEMKSWLIELGAAIGGLDVAGMATPTGCSAPVGPVEQPEQMGAPEERGTTGSSGAPATKRAS